MAAGVVLGVTIFTDEWTVQTVVTTGLWAMLAVMFVAGFIVSSRKVRSAALAPDEVIHTCAVARSSASC